MTNDSESQLPAEDADEAGSVADAPAEAVPRARVPELLHAAVASVGGVERPGQLRMAEAVADAVDHGEHLLVQAGTGTGKSLAYLVPALAHGDRVVVATATLALQRQLVERDLPRTVEALHPVLRRRPLFAMLKGRSNYLCLHRANEGTPGEEGEGLFDPVEALGGPAGKLGKEVLRLRDWADETETGDRDDMSPGVSDRAWAQLAVTSKECLGATRCAYGQECFAEKARERAKLADVVVTNHAMLAIDAIEGAPVLPEHGLLIVDEAHELVNRVTGAATAELTVGAVNRTVKRAARLANEKAVDALQAAAENYHGLMETAQPGRVEELPEYLAYAVTAIRDASRQVITSLGETRDKGLSDEDAVRKQAMAAAESLHETADRLLQDSEYDVVWIERSDRYGLGTASLRVAPLSVSGLLREGLYKERAVVLTSATLKLGGDFTGVAASVGLPSDARLPDVRTPGDNPEAVGEGMGDEPVPHWRGIDVGSPFKYSKQGILYVARHLADPGRDPERPDMLDELADLIGAAGGRTLGLFSSMRGAQAAAEAMRERLDQRILLQGEDTLGELIREFASDATTCLFGTLSLWQGVDVPGSACQLVVMDRIPFPRPDDPLMSARQKDVEQRGGNGFMAVAATHAALLMAQGAGRLVRAAEDRGVVAVLDPRVETKRYGGFFRSSMPEFWYTTDRNQVRRSLAAIDDSAAPVRPVPKRG
ncbi:ATP-dependent DNA helicase [Kitasatospora purpeofusca]|uniref:ATP-dependent DNA helicase n=1 Tax=Kitasatospora purpeofusca TaxID=67352 RepID=UPI00225B72FF|nr:ATP-dependent DNA helicase [Kitasatospora purpeofusca]MCX4757718.1 ATP-dependent DNA helicase [Kitasatospora purpeofusca]WSR34578.1 ATP-dependent DNA helicase [Kitasatospora purpeofusca]WSR42787.1 ATP-dependent DNA helicase [Kitasatospora purpeofusca]